MGGGGAAREWLRICRAHAPLRWPDWRPNKPRNCSIRPRASDSSARPARWRRARGRPDGNSFVEGLFRALGYNQNTWPMRRMGELLRVAEHRRLRHGLAGALVGRRRLAAHGCFRAGPDHIRKDSGTLVRERESFSDVVLPRNLWRFSGLRPANQPQRRLALAATGWLTKISFPVWKLGSPRKNPGPPRRFPVACLQAAEDISGRGTGDCAPRACPGPAALGATPGDGPGCQCDLPWFWVRAAAAENRCADAGSATGWPGAQDNALAASGRRAECWAGRTGRNSIGPRQQASCKGSLISATIHPSRGCSFRLGGGFSVSAKAGLEVRGPADRPEPRRGGPTE